MFCLNKLISNSNGETVIFFFKYTFMKLIFTENKHLPFLRS